MERLHTDLANKQMLPSEHLVDAGYVNALNIVASQQTYDIDLIGPELPDTQWQATQQTGYDISQFHLDWQQEQAICPRGRQAAIGMKGQHPMVIQSLMSASVE